MDGCVFAIDPHSESKAVWILQYIWMLQHWQRNWTFNLWLWCACLLEQIINQPQPKHVKLVVIKKTWILTKAIMIWPWYFGFSESAQKYLVFIWFLCLFENHCYCKGIFVFLELNKCHFVKKFVSFLQHYFSV